MLPEEEDLAKRERLPVDERKRRVMAFVIKPHGTNIAIGFFGGGWARAFERQCEGKERGSGPRSTSGCDDLPIKVATTALSRMYREKAVAESIQSDRIHLTRWSLDETSLGAYSVPEPGHWAAHEILRRPVAVGAGDARRNRLFFAGEGTARGVYNGSYPGAYETGVQAARTINAEMLAEHGAPAGKPVPPPKKRRKTKGHN